MSLSSKRGVRSDTLPAVITLDRVDSTNTYLASLWNSEAQLEAFTTVIANFQTAGRGRLGRTWQSPPGSALLASFLVPVASHHLSWLSFLGGLATAEALEPLIPPKPVSLKWPNDVLIGEKKVAGVLAEHLGTRNGLDWVALGVGANLSQDASDLPAPVRSALSATSIVIEGGPRVDADALATKIATLLRGFVNTVNEGDLEVLHRSYSLRCTTLNRKISVLLPDNTVVQGNATGIETDGALRVQDVFDKTHKIHAGDVTHVRHRTQPAPLSGGTLDRFES